MSYYESDQKLLPVIINGSNTSLPQAFLLALQRTLAENELLDIMPETNYKAAVAVIQRWKTDFPDTYVQLQKAIDEPIGKFIEDLEDYSITAYEKFERIYPTLTAGSVFSPFLGFDVVELYESAVRGLRSKDIQAFMSFMTNLASSWRRISPRHLSAIQKCCRILLKSAIAVASIKST